MNRLRSYKWFWGTLAVWLFSFTVSAWALIYSTFHLNPQTISKFSCEINGYQTQVEFSSTRGKMDLSMESLTKKWQEKGWVNITTKINLAGVLLGVPKQYQPQLDPLLQIRAFQKAGSLRMLGLWFDGQSNQTYQWVSDMPQEALQAQDPARMDFPLKPPTQAFGLLNIKTKKMSVCLWSVKTVGEPGPFFAQIASAQGFSARSLSGSGDETSYLLQKGSTRLIGVAKKEGNKTTISLMALNQI